MQASMITAMCLVDANVLHATEMICSTRLLLAQVASHAVRPLTMESGAPVMGEQPLRRDRTVVRRDDRWVEDSTLGPAEEQSRRANSLE